jgi:hypothetical protein
MRGKIFLILTLALLFVSMASASTTLTVKTVPFGEISLNLRPSGTIDVVERFKETADNYGDATFTYSGTLPSFDLTYFIKKNGEKVINGIIESKTAGGEIYLELIPSGFEIVNAPEPVVEIELNITNETVEDIAEEVIEETNSTKKIKDKITGFSIFKNDDGTMNWSFFYYFGGAVVLALIIFFFLKIKKTPRGIKITKLSDLKKDQTNSLKEAKEEIEEYEKKMKDLEEKIKDIKTNLSKPKNADKISAIKKKMIDEEKELMKLRKEQKDDENDE